MFLRIVTRHLGRLTSSPLAPISNSIYHNVPCRSMASPAKQPKLLTIGTHDGVFHCDESLACYLIKRLPEYKDAQIVRSRVQADLDKCDIVVDVGRVYDVDALRFDHHQPTFQDTLSTLFPKKTFGNVRLSSAGLVYGHYGHQIIGDILGLPKDDPKTDKVFDMVYEQFIKEIDAIDNGVNMFDGEPRYTIGTHLSARVGQLKPDWNEESSASILYERFLKAVNLTGAEFMERIRYFADVWMPARTLVQEAFDRRLEVHPSGSIVVLEKSCPWIAHLFEIEEAANAKGTIKYVIFSDKPTDWRIRAVPITPESFENRLPIRTEWRGLVNAELDAKSGVDGCVFVHASGFIGGNRSKEGAIAMAVNCLTD